MPAVTPGISPGERQDPLPAPPAEARTSTELRRTEVGAEGEEDGGEVKDLNKGF